jgi:hypothetical protein
MTARRLVSGVTVGVLGLSVALGLAIGLLAEARSWSVPAVYAAGAVVLLLAATAGPLALSKPADERLRRYVRQKRHDPTLRIAASAHKARMSSEGAYSVGEFITRVTKTGE